MTFARILRFNSQSRVRLTEARSVSSQIQNGESTKKTDGPSWSPRVRNLILLVERAVVDSTLAASVTQPFDCESCDVVVKCELYLIG